MISEIFILKTDSLNPYRNLATEKYLFDNLKKDTLILYLWKNENTVVIGRNQNPWAECNCNLLESEGGHLARRLTGGGAVYHDIGNLNFTFICHQDDYALSKHLEVIKEAALMADIETEISGRNDILAKGRKFSGNAFYTSGGKSLHHGTILISADTEKMSRYLTPSKQKLKAKGVKSVESRVINLSELSHGLSPEIMADNMISATGKVFGVPVREYSPENPQEIEKLTGEFFDWDFRYGKTIAFSITADGIFDWGQAQLCLNIENGVISDAVLYTDSLDHSIQQTVSEALNGVRLSFIEISSALNRSMPKSIAQDLVSILKDLIS